MIAIAIEVLWLLIGAICLAGVIWLVLYGINNYVTPIPDRLQQGIWFIVLLLIIIGALTLLAGGSLRPPFKVGSAWPLVPHQHLLQSV